MSVFKPRHRRISIRLTEAEYEKLCGLSRSIGARSVSDCARTAVRNVTGAAHSDAESVIEELRALDRRLQVVAREVERLALSVGLVPSISEL